MSITGNTIDGRKRTGSIDPDSLSIGINVTPLVDDITVIGNTVRHTARRCISASGENMVISGNTLEYCAQPNLTFPDPSQEGAILISNDTYVWCLGRRKEYQRCW